LDVRITIPAAFFWAMMASRYLSLMTSDSVDF